MKKLFAMLMLAQLAACASPSQKNAASDAINRELDAAAPTKEAGGNTEAAVNDALLPPLSAAIGGKPVETRFDLVVNNTPVQQVFMAIVTGTRYSMLVHPEVSGNISLNLKDVTVYEALEAIRDLYGYEYRMDGMRIYIQPLSLQTRIFHVNYLTGVRAGTSSVRVTSSALTDSQAGASPQGMQTANQGTTIIGDGGDDKDGNRKSLKFERGTDNSSKVTTTTVTDFWSELAQSLREIVGDGRGRLVRVSPMTGVIVVRAMPDELKNVGAYLKASQISVERQVILEAKIIEVQLGTSFQTGVNWSAFKSGTNSAVSGGVVGAGTTLTPGVKGTVMTPTPITSPTLTATPGASLANPAISGGSLFGLAFQTSNFAALLNFLETQGSVHVLSSPRIATINNQKAVLKVGTDEFFVTEVSGGTQATANVAGTAPTVKVQPFFSGIALDVTPRIDENNEIILHVHPSVSAVNTVNKQLNLGTNIGTYNLPLASSTVSETDSIVRTRDGQIVAIGGLMRQAMTDERSGIPWLPSFLFGQTSTSMQKRELVILLKSTVVDSDKDWSEDIVRSRDRVGGMTR